MPLKQQVRGWEQACDEWGTVCTKQSIDETERKTQSVIENEKSKVYQITLY